MSEKTCAACDCKLEGDVIDVKVACVAINLKRLRKE
jgi:hypothetical protein